MKNVKREKTHIIKIRMKQETTDETDETILGHYKDNKASYEQLYIHKSNNLEEMNKFLKNYKLPKLNQDEINYLNSPITISKIGVNKSLSPPKKSSWSEEVASILYNFF